MIVKKGVVFAVILLFLSVSVIPSTGTTDAKQTTMPTTSGNTLYVGGNGTGNYTKIQDAINDSENGDTVFVYDDSSPYYENIVVDKSINLTGENKETTIVDGQSNGDVMNVVADYVKISEFTIQNSRGDDYKAGISIRSNSSLITGNILTKNYHSGLYMEYGHNNTIIKNNITRNENYGIHLRRKANNNLITQNTIIDNGNDGILVILNSGNIITNNLITNSVGAGVFLSLKTEENIVNRNMILNNSGDGIYIWQSHRNQIHNNTIMGNNKVGIQLHSATGNSISNNRINDNHGYGVEALSSTNNQIVQNIIKHNRRGLKFTEGGNNVIKKNNITYNTRGIYLTNSWNNEISYNNFIMNLEDARAFICRNSWECNYWNRPRLLPRPIVSWQIYWIIEPGYYAPGLPLIYPWLEYDWNPAQEPYDIGV